MSDITEFAEWEALNRTLAEEELSQDAQRKLEMEGTSSGDEHGEGSSAIAGSFLDQNGDEVARNGEICSVIQEEEKETVVVYADIEMKDEGNDDDGGVRLDSRPYTWPSINPIAADDDDSEILDEATHYAQVKLAKENSQWKAEMDAIDSRIDAEVLARIAQPFLHAFDIPANEAAEFGENLKVANREDLDELVKATKESLVVDLLAAVDTKEYVNLLVKDSTDHSQVVSGHNHFLTPLDELVASYAREHPFYCNSTHDIDDMDEFTDDVSTFARHAGMTDAKADAATMKAIVTYNDSRHSELQGADGNYSSEVNGAIATLPSPNEAFEIRKLMEISDARKRKWQFEEEAKKDLENAEADERAAKRQRKREKKERRLAEKTTKLAKIPSKDKDMEHRASMVAPTAGSPPPEQAVEDDIKVTHQVPKSEVERLGSTAFLSEPQLPVISPISKKRKRPKSGSEISPFFAKVPTPNSNTGASLSDVTIYQDRLTPTRLSKSTTKPISSPYFVKSLVSSTQQPAKEAPPSLSIVSTNGVTSSHVPAVTASPNTPLIFILPTVRPPGMPKKVWRYLNKERSEGSIQGDSFAATSFSVMPMVDGSCPNHVPKAVWRHLSEMKSGERAEASIQGDSIASAPPRVSQSIDGRRPKGMPRNVWRDLQRKKISSISVSESVQASGVVDGSQADEATTSVRQHMNEPSVVVAKATKDISSNLHGEPKKDTAQEELIRSDTKFVDGEPSKRKRKKKRNKNKLTSEEPVKSLAPNSVPLAVQQRPSSLNRRTGSDSSSGLKTRQLSSGSIINPPKSQLAVEAAGERPAFSLFKEQGDEDKPLQWKISAFDMVYADPTTSVPSARESSIESRNQSQKDDGRRSSHNMFLQRNADVSDSDGLVALAELNDANSQTRKGGRRDRGRKRMSGIELENSYDIQDLKARHS
jgi:hypothetical protein